MTHPYAPPTKARHHLFLAAAAGLALGLLAPASAEDLVPLKLELPKPMFVGTPVPVRLPNLETPRVGRRPDFMVPKGVVNLALNKKVTSSDMEPVLGDLSLITDGEKDGDEGNYVELGKGKQWVQIDLEKPAKLYAIVVWHFHSQARAYKAVAVQVSNDPNFVDATGPPRLPPKWFTVERGLCPPGLALVKKLAALSLEPFHSSYRLPWKSLVPDLVT